MAHHTAEAIVFDVPSRFSSNVPLIFGASAMTCYLKSFAILQSKKQMTLLQRPPQFRNRAIRPPQCALQRTDPTAASVGQTKL